MNKKLVVFMATLWGINVTLPAQTVSNVQFEQVDNKVKITYLLDKQADISVSVSEDGGKTNSSPLQQVSGDVGKSVAAGTKILWWDVLAERESLVGSNICFKVSPSDCDKLSFTVGGVSFTMVYVQGGTFTMGATPEQGTDAFSNEKPAHRVTLSDYYIGQTEVTQALWQAVMGTTIRQQRHKATTLGCRLCGVGADYPMYYVNWSEVTEFCQRLSTLIGRTFVLPTEAQWEYAARGGKLSIGYKYSGSNSLDAVAWYFLNTGSKKRNRTFPVAQKSPNELGIYDMSGNVREWCSDCHDSYNSSAVSDPTGPMLGSSLYYVTRGGHYYGGASECRVAYRASDILDDRTSYIGFRVVLLR